MTEILDAAVVLLILLGCGIGGLFVRPLLAEHHRSHDTVELVRLVITMLVTFAALVLGLLTTSVKTSFDTVGADLRALSIDLIQLDQIMRDYGPATDEARAKLRRYTAQAIATTWTDETPPTGAALPTGAAPRRTRSLEDVQLGVMLLQVEATLRGLEPQDEMHRKLAFDAINMFERLSQRRWKLIGEAESEISQPFYVVLVFWLAVVFASFGLSAPRNLLVFVMLGLGALSIASAVFVILDLDAPFTGTFADSSQPLREALAHLER
jgi:hypothetical protein